ncbi:hypothetical protein AAEX37_00540 [Oligella sp. MSHR50489EDL]|uniref:DUF3649 domain-containing protein n=1 Tax=Oligella sp. MSHR50489EDL TaxID=3139409 RepID=UPI003D818207
MRYMVILSRCFAAIVGGYVLAALFSVAVLALPGSLTEKVLVGAMGSFLFYAAIVIWVFAVQSVWRVWIGLAVSGLLLLIPATWVWCCVQ